MPFLLTLDVQASAFNFAGLIFARLGLGVFEAGFAPMVPFYLCECSLVMLVKTNILGQRFGIRRMSSVFGLHIGLVSPQFRVLLVGLLHLESNTFTHRFQIGGCCSSSRYST